MATFLNCQTCLLGGVTDSGKLILASSMSTRNPSNGLLSVLNPPVFKAQSSQESIVKAT